MKVKLESEKVGLKLSIQKMKIMASSPITSWQIDGEIMETVTDFIFFSSVQFSHSVVSDSWRPHESQHARPPCPSSILRHSAFFTVQLSHAYMTTGKTIALTRQTFVGKCLPIAKLLDKSLKLVLLKVPGTYTDIELYSDYNTSTVLFFSNQVPVSTSS